MEKFVEKLSEYNILNYLLPGVVLDYLFNILLGVELIHGTMIENLFVYYFIGLTVSRVGSLIIRPICEKIGWVKCVDYNEYIEASWKDKKIDILSEQNNTYRTIFAGFIILIFARIYIAIMNNFNLLLAWNKEIILILLAILLAFSYRKQTKYVVDRVQKVREGDKE